MEYNFKIVGSCSKEFICQVCMKLLKEPQLTDCCGQNFCRACLNRFYEKKGKKQCPHCRSETFAHILNKPLKRTINELKVYCSNRSKGCIAMTKLEALERHLSTDNPYGCNYVLIKCPNEDCGKSCLRKDITYHAKNTCLRRKVKCKFCGEIGQYNYITSDKLHFGHLIHCQEYPVDCPRRCGTVRNLKHKDLEPHKEVCPLEPVQCPFREAGCTQQELVRKDLDRHIKSSNQQHLLLLMDSHKTLLASHKTLMSTHVGILREHKERQMSVAGVASELEALQTTVKDKAVASSLEQITTTLNQVSLQMKKEGDLIQLTFRISDETKEWISSSFTVDSTRMYLHVHVVENVPPQAYYQYTLRLFQLTAERMGRRGKHQLKIEYQFDQPINEGTTEPNSIDTTKAIVQLCANCTQHTIFTPLQKQQSSGKQIAQLHVWLNHQIHGVTMTLEKHQCNSAARDTII